MTTEKKERIVAEIISIGDEITNGSILDTNSQWLSKKLSDLGIRVLYHSTVGDEQDAMLDVFRIAGKRADLIIMTGGLGPTEDDLTRQTVAELLQVPLVFDEASWKYINELFQKRNRPMPESNRIQAYFPKGANVIFNPGGTAPGFDVVGSRKIWHGPDTNFRIMAFPGVPAELKEMWHSSARQLVENMVEEWLGHKRYIKYRSIHCFGAGESVIESRLPHLINRDHVPRVGITASNTIITLRIAAESTSEEECDRQINVTAALIYDKLGTLIFGENGITLGESVSELLRKRKETVHVLEWGTQGRLSSSLDRDVLAAGCVMTDHDPFLTENLESCGFCTNGRFLADYTLVVGPYPEDDAENRNVSVLLWDRANNQWDRQEFVGDVHPSIVNASFCHRALNVLRLLLISKNAAV
ncbi:MAG: hypothetical protein IKW74_06345 [Thermoguttaceae bacterium]|nr:hypothetical protein [Thermoguttaceae bacterium]